MSERGLMRMLVRGLHVGICTEDEKNARKGMVIGYLMKHVKVSRENGRNRTFISM